MTKIKLLAVSFLAMIQQCIAKSNDPFIYIDAGAGFGKNTMLKASLDVIYKRHLVSFGIHLYEQEATNTPADYDGGFTLFSDSHKLYTELDGYHIMYGYTFTFHKPYIRFVAKGGVFWGNYHHPENFIPQRPSGSFFPGANYSYTQVETATIALVLNPVIELPSRCVGVSVGPFAILSPKVNGGGVEINFLLGGLRERLYHRVQIEEGK